MPQITAAPYEAGVGSILSFQLHVRKNTFGALNMYGSTPSAFDDESQFIGSVLAQHAFVAMAATAAQRRDGAAVGSPHRCRSRWFDDRRAGIRKV